MIDVDVISRDHGTAMRLEKKRHVRYQKTCPTSGTWREARTIHLQLESRGGHMVPRRIDAFAFAFR